MIEWTSYNVKKIKYSKLIQCYSHPLLKVSSAQYEYHRTDTQQCKQKIKNNKLMK